MKVLSDVVTVPSDTQNYLSILSHMENSVTRIIKLLSTCINKDFKWLIILSQHQVRVFKVGYQSELILFDYLF